MSEQTRSRKRAVRLTPHALEKLKDALHAKWNADSRSGKLTREARSELLGVSVATAERILAGKGVDRPTLTLAFKNLGLRWDDSCCLLVSPEPASDRDPGSELVTPEKGKYTKGRVTRVVFGGALMVTLLVTGAQRFVPGDRKQDNSWWPTFERALSDGSSSYHQGDFKQARAQLSKAIELAREHKSANDLASALRMSGDLATARGSFEEARSRYEEALTLREVFQENRSEPALLEALGDLETRIGDLGAAKRHLTQSLSMFEKYKDSVGVAMASRDLGSVALLQKDFARANSFFAASLLAVRGLGKPDIETDVKGRQALVQRDLGRYDVARRMLNECLLYWKMRDHPRWVATTQFQLGTVEAMAGSKDAALALLKLSRKGFEGVGDRAGSADSSSWCTKLSTGQVKGTYHVEGFRTTRVATPVRGR